MMAPWGICYLMVECHGVMLGMVVSGNQVHKMVLGRSAEAGLEAYPHRRVHRGVHESCS